VRADPHSLHLTQYTHPPLQWLQAKINNDIIYLLCVSGICSFIHSFLLRSSILNSFRISDFQKIRNLQSIRFNSLVTPFVTSSFLRKNLATPRKHSAWLLYHFPFPIAPQKVLSLTSRFPCLSSRTKWYCSFYLASYQPREIVVTVYYVVFEIIISPIKELNL
jgi:hypothetical protein